MTRTRVSSGQAVKRPVAATPDASLPLDASVLSIVFPSCPALKWRRRMLRANDEIADRRFVDEPSV
jgi:hypothetical protein